MRLSIGSLLFITDDGLPVEKDAGKEVSAVAAILLHTNAANIIVRRSFLIAGYFPGVVLQVFSS